MKTAERKSDRAGTGRVESDVVMLRLGEAKRRWRREGEHAGGFGEADRPPASSRDGGLALSRRPRITITSFPTQLV